MLHLFQQLSIEILCNTLSAHISQQMGAKNISYDELDDTVSFEDLIKKFECRLSIAVRETLQNN